VSCSPSFPERDSCAAWPSSYRGLTADRRQAFPDNAPLTFPLTLEDEVSFCGYTSEKSFGAWSYFVERPAGNVLVDSPRAAAPLLERLSARGGVALMVLSQRDDVADHAAIRRRFGCDRIIHRADGVRGLERYVDGEERRPDGLVRITLKKAYTDGTIAVDMEVPSGPLFEVLDVAGVAGKLQQLLDHGHEVVDRSHPRQRVPASKRPASHGDHHRGPDQIEGNAAPVQLLRAATVVTGSDGGRAGQPQIAVEDRSDVVTHRGIGRPGLLRDAPC
jgi:hypothetical protein